MTDTLLGKMIKVRLDRGGIKIQQVYAGLNYSLCAIGLTGVWFVSESWLAVLFAFIASLHFTRRIA